MLIFHQPTVIQTVIRESGGDEMILQQVQSPRVGRTYLKINGAANFSTGFVVDTVFAGDMLIVSGYI